MRGVGWRDLSVCVCYLYVLYIDEIPAWATRAHGICCLPDFFGASEQEPLLPCSTTACCIIYAVCSITAERFVTIVLADLEQCGTVLDMPGSLHQLELCFQHYTSAQSLRYKTVFTSWNCVFSIIVFYTSAQSLRYKAVVTKLWSYAFSPLLILSCYCVSMQGSLHQLKLCFQCHAYTE